MDIGLDYYSTEREKAPQSTYDLVRASVMEFHEATGQFVARDEDAVPPSGVTQMRSNLIQEEREELLKEICDLAYVHAGGDVEWYDTSSKNLIAQLELICTVLYMDFRTAFQRVHENNLGRIKQDDGTIQRREDGKIIKNPNAPKVYLGDLV